MRPYFWRDVWASTAGMTPSNGYRWPSDVNGVMGELDGGRVNRLDRTMLWIVQVGLLLGVVFVWTGHGNRLLVALAAPSAIVVLRGMWRYGVHVRHVREMRRIIDEMERRDGA